MRRAGIVLTLVLAAGLASGCFVIDEIDAGQDLMNEHRDTSNDAPVEHAAPEEDGSGSDGLVARVKDWWAGLGSDSGTAAPGGGGPPPHPDDVLGTCDLGGSLTFMRKFDCQRQGGKFKPRRKSGS